jgi:predicted acylesterase/phospholipase RssA
MANEIKGTPQSARTAVETSQPGTPAGKESFLARATAALAACLTRLLRLARYAYLLRVPILVGVFLFAFPVLALAPGSGLRSLFQNLFLMGPLATFWSTVAALVLAWSVLLTGRIVLLNCEDRFNVPSKMTAATLKGWHFFGILALALPAILGQFTQQGDFRPNEGLCMPCVWAVVAAAFFAYLLAFVALWVAVWLAPPGTQGSALTFPCFPFMRRWLQWADRHHVLPKGLRLGLWIRRRLPGSLWRGYLASDGFLWSGHWLALLFGLATAALYFFIDWWHGRSVGLQDASVTALTFVLILLLNTNWILSFAAFFLDHFRIPVLLPLALFALISGNVRSSDHFFQVQPGKDRSALSPGDVLRARSNKPIVVIATAGGGIQAAAWTTQVLAGLQQQYEEWYPGQSFAENVTVISSVSGGATGSMFYANLYDRTLPQHFDAKKLLTLTDVASLSSLDDVAWALVYHDIPRIFFSSRNKIFDRGYILEETWKERGKINQPLSGWRDGLKDGWRPAMIFNSTIAETGEQLAFSTTRWKQELDPETNKEIVPRRRDFYDMYSKEGLDLPVVTAVRLAASFPYVTPAARPNTPAPDDYHMIDGGYYDNYGVSNLIAWLEEGLTDLQSTCNQSGSGPKDKQPCAMPQILVIQIRSFPPDAEAQPRKKGWGFQLYAPIEGLISVRSTAQLVRDREALTLFSRRWESKDPRIAPVNMQFATFEFGGCKTDEEGPQGKNKAIRDKAVNPPLSWAMNPSQVQAVKDDWNARVARANACKSDPNIDKVRCFFDPHSTRCGNLPHGPD